MTMFRIMVKKKRGGGTAAVFDHHCASPIAKPGVGSLYGLYVVMWVIHIHVYVFISGDCA